MKIVAIIQARMNSSRLPGKVLMPIMDKPMLAYEIDRVRSSSLIHEIVVATTDDDKDLPIVELCDRLGVSYYRGSEHDVLSRYYHAARQYGADIIVRLTADCPVIDPKVIDRVIQAFLDYESGVDYLSNIYTRSYPRGMDTEVFSMATLKSAYDNATLDEEREHVTPFIYHRPERFKIKNLAYHKDFSHHRWTVDTPEDFSLIRLLIVALHPLNPLFTLEDLLSLLHRRPEWRQINAHIVQKTVLAATESERSLPSSSRAQSNMRRLITKYARLNRVPVSDDTSRFMKDLAADLDLDMLSLPTGAECLTWVVPEKWTVREAYIETINGVRIADFHEHPITLHSHSASFSGTISREELISRITVHPDQPDRKTYVCRWQYHLGEKNQWAFSLPASTVRKMKDPVYRVHIDTEFGNGNLEVIDWILPGERQETVFLAAHSCHPGQVNDGIACIAVLIELFQYLKQLPQRKYTYRLIIGPEYYAAAAILEYGPQIDKLKYGLYLDMMAHDSPICFSRSYAGNTLIDKAVRNVLNKQTEPYIEAEYRGLYGNDEMFYDGPGFGIPTVGLARYPYANYHTDLDDAEHCDFTKLEQSLDALKDIVDVMESDIVPIRTYKGPLYLSKYNLYIDPKINQTGYRHIQEIQILMDGERSCLEIADAVRTNYAFVREFVEELYKQGLVTIKGKRALAEVTK